MKKNIHPKWNKDSKIIYNGKAIMTVGSTIPEMHVEIWSGNHPFYTGKQTLVDTDNLVEKFMKKRSQAQDKGIVVSKKAKQLKRKASSSQTGAVTLKDMLSKIQ